MLRKFLTDLKKDTVPLNYGRHIVTEWSVQYAKQFADGTRPLRVLDIGFGPGTDLKNIREALKANGYECELYGLDTYKPSLDAGPSLGIQAAYCNIESQKFPFADKFFDIIVANQVIEHTKEIFWIYSEISRILKTGGVVITGAPNIASFHNRVALLCGVQPTNIEVLGEHVRGFTAASFIKFVEADGYFKNIGVRGTNFYPFPRWIAQPLAAMFPRLAVGIFLLSQRTDKPGLFRDVLKTRVYATPYYTGQPENNL